MYDLFDKNPVFFGTHFQLQYELGNLRVGGSEDDEEQ